MVWVPALRYGQAAVLAKNGVELELAALRQSRALIRERLRSSAAHRGSPGPHRLPGLGSVGLLPLPLGEGWGEGSSLNKGRPSPPPMPSPCPLPEGEGKEGMHTERVHVGGWYVFGRLLRLRRAPQGQADQGRACLSEASLRGPRLTRGAAAKPEGPETVAAQRHTARRRPTHQTISA